MPRITFVLVTYGGGELAAHCLEVLAAHTEQPYEVVVVDSASPDGTGEWLQTNLTGVTVLRMLTNLGFGAGCNLGVGHARTELVCLLNADVEVTDGWLAPLLAVLDEHPAAAGVAPLMVYPDGRVQEAGSVMGGDGFSRGWLDGITDVTGLYPRVVDYASAACLVIRRRALGEAGGFSPAYHIAYYEDVDLQFRLRELGWQVWLQPAATVRHVRHGTSSTSRAQELSAINRPIFVQRWRSEMATRSPALDAPDHEHRLWWLRDQVAEVRVLLVAPQLARTDHRLVALAMAWRSAHTAAAVTLLITGSADAAPAEALRADGIELVANIADPVEAGNWSQQRCGLYDVLVAVGAGAVSSAMAVTDGQLAAIRVFDLAVTEHRAYERRFDTASPGHMRRRLGAHASWLREAAMAGLRWAQVVVCGGAPVAEWASTVLPDTVTHILESPVVPAAEVSGPRGRSGLVFVGDLGVAQPDPTWLGGTAPAVTELTDELLPALALRHPGLRLRLLGVDKTTAQIVHSGSVDVLTEVLDPQPHLASARLQLAPVRHSAGMSFGLVESMAVGLPFVTTRAAAEGLPLDGVAEHVLADSAAEMVERADRLLRDDALWLDVQSELRIQCRERLSARHFAASFVDFLADCGVAPPPIASVLGAISGGRVDGCAVVAARQPTIAVRLPLCATG